MSIYAAVNYTDPNAAVDWLCKAFGFTADNVFHDDAGTVRHAELSLGTGKVMVSGPREPGWLGGTTATPLASPISLYAVVDDPVAHHDNAVAEGANIVRGLEHTDYGSHEYSARDPEGNLWSFGTYRPRVVGGELTHSHARCTDSLIARSTSATRSADTGR